MSAKESQMTQHFKSERENDKEVFAGRLVVSVGMVMVLMLLAAQVFAADASTGYAAARWHPLHFKPAIERADDNACLTCHAEVLKPSVRAQSPAGVRADQSLAWYQTLDIYSGDQDNFHRRHLLGDIAKRYMNLRCNTCHQGHDPRDEAPGTSATAQATGYTLRKQVDPKTCLMCHGQFNFPVMGLPGPWSEHGETFGNNCLTCHEGIRTTRHNVNFLKPRAIEEAGRESAEHCYGCHGGRAWYRIHFPYPRHAWEGMDKEVPDWARYRPTQSEPRFLLEESVSTPATVPVPAAKTSGAASSTQHGKVARKATSSPYPHMNVKGKQHVSPL
jgi:nitrate/TMAO reductase-like tetraheme cytochrome c subunit